MSNVLVRASEDLIEFAATDLEIGISVKVPGKIIETGAITIPAKKFIDVVRELPQNNPVDISTTSNHRMVISCDKGKYRIAGLSDDDFPDLTFDTGGGSVIDGETLCSAIYKTQFSASDDDVRQILHALSFSIDSEKTEIVATNGVSKLALAHCPSIDISEEDKGIIVPIKSVREILKIFADSAEINVAIKNNQLILEDDDIVFSSMLVEGEFPVYNRVIPEPSDKHVIVNRDMLLKCVKRVSLLSDTKNFSIKLDITPEMISLTSKSHEVGDAEDSVECESGTGNILIAVDYRTLIASLNHIESDSAVLEFNESTTPMVIKPNSVDGHICVIMPMKTKDVEESIKNDNEESQDAVVASEAVDENVNENVEIEEE